MSEFALEELICLHLDEVERPSADRRPSRAATAGGLSNALGGDRERVSVRIQLLSALSTLQQSGLVSEVLVDAEDRSEKAYALTEAGSERARTIRDRLAERTVVVENGGRESVQLLDLDDRVPEPTLGAALRRVGEDGVVRLGGEAVERFVDREREREVVESAVEAVDGGATRTVLVSGGPGSGKTAFGRHVRDRVEERGIEWVGERATASEADPFALVERVLDALTGEAATPRLPVDGAGAEDRESYLAHRRAMFHDVAQQITTVVGDRPHVVFVDDLHHADLGSLNLLRYLVESVEDVPVLFLGTFRPEELSLSSPLVDPPEESAYELIELSPLDLGATRRIVERVLDGRGAPESFVERIHDHAGGNPLFVTETLTQLLEAGDVDPGVGHFPDDETDLGLPDATKTAVEARIDALDEGSRALLQRASVAGDAVPFDLLAAVCDRPEPELREYADLLAESWLWEADGDGYRFASEVTRQAIREGSNLAVERETHRRIAETLAERDVVESPAEVATHYEAAGEDGPALEWYLTAAERATDRYANEVAVGHYEAALIVARRLDADASVIEILEDLGGVYTVLGEFNDADRRFQYVWEQSDDPERRRSAAARRAGIRTSRGEYEAAIEHADVGLGIPTEGEDANTTDGDPGCDYPPTEAVCTLLDRKGWALLQQGDLDGAETLFESQLAIARTLSEPALIGQALGHRGDVALKRGDVGTAVESFETAIDTLGDTDEESLLSNCLNNLGIIRWKSGDLETAREHLARSLSIQRDRGDPVKIANLTNNLGILDLKRCRWDDAIDRFEECVAEGERVGDDQLLANALGNLALVHVKRGDLETATERAAKSLRVARDIDNQWVVAIVRVIQAEVDACRGEFERAASRADDGVEIAEAIGAEESRADALVQFGRARRNLGDVEGAVEAHEEARDLSRDLGTPQSEYYALAELAADHLADDRIETAVETAEEVLTAPEGVAHRPLVVAQARTTLGACSLARGDHETAVDHCREAIATAGEVDVRPIEARARFELGRVEADRGRDDATEQFERARSLADSIGAAHLRRRCDRALDDE